MSELNKEQYNIILTDLYGEEPKRNAEENLNVEHLSITNIDPKFPVFGFITTDCFEHLRPLINLVCKFGTNPSINIIFLVAPGSPGTFLTDKAIFALNQNSNIDDIEHGEINIHGFNHKVKRSNFEGSDFKEVNLLGRDYLKNDFFLTLDYEKLQLILDKQN